jgi:hypothetical protein
MNVKFERVVKLGSITAIQPQVIQGYVVLQVRTGKAFTGYVNGKRNDDGGQLLVKVAKTVYRRSALKDFKKL